MMFNLFRQIDLFDIIRGVNTRKIKKPKMTSKSYMWYSPVYTSVAKEMIAIAVDFYNSAIKYSVENDNTVFLDLGGGSGKPSLLACESKAFSRVINVEINEELSRIASENFTKKRIYNNAESVTANVENFQQMKGILNKLSSGFGEEYTLFIFNKNSYDYQVLENTLILIDKYGPKNSLYLYQNPVHARTLTYCNYLEVQRDSYASNSHKNFKYSIWWKQKKK